MPFVNIRMIEGRSKARKDEIARRVTAAVSELAEIPPGDVWVVFEDVTADDWFVGAERVSTLRKRAAKAARRRP
jgi:4-oxalocrotonate tautomerase